MTTRQTPDAVRATVRAVLNATPHAETCELHLDLGPRTNLCSCDHIIRAMLAFAALDSRAGDAGEGDIETRARAIAQQVVPYEAHSPHVSARQMDRRRIAKAAARLALSATPAPAVDAPTERQAALAKLTAMDDEIGLPDERLPISPNAVDAVPVGEVTEAMVDAALNARLPGGTPVLAYLPSEANWTPLERAREIVRCALSAALSHGEGRK
jgi:hypothetical protein